MEPKATIAFPVDRNSIERRVVEIVAYALDRSPSKVPLTASFWTDLGAESLDMLDIAFSLERNFGIRVPHSDLVARAVDHFGEEAILDKGRITDFGLELIRRSMPELDLSKIRLGLTPMDFRKMITVESVVRVVNRLLDYKEGQLCPACSGRLVDSESNPELECARCGLTQPYASGDQVLIDDLDALARDIGLPAPRTISAGVSASQ